MNKKIIVAPLNWGLGHASRCVPIIHFLSKNKFTPIIASDGKALEFLKKEFPDLECIKLPSYGISYAKNLKLGLLFQIPKVLSVIKKEQKKIASYIALNSDVVGIISDNRFGVRNIKIPSVYITHQIQVFSGITTFFSSKTHQYYIKKFDECWVPDAKENKLSGVLSKPTSKGFALKNIGILSRFKKGTLPQKNDVLIILSGIESQRQALEDKLIFEFRNSKQKVVLIQGLIEKEKKSFEKNGIKIYNYLLSSELENEIKQSKLIICRSGYSSIMDLAVLDKKAFFIPTQNQPEQEYLAKYLEANKIAAYSTEKEFVKERINVVNNYKGLSSKNTTLDLNLLSLFKCK